MYLDKNEVLKTTLRVSRYTYCLHCVLSGMNPKHLLYLTGHLDICVTLNIYTHVDFDNVKKEVKSLEEVVLSIQEMMVVLQRMTINICGKSCRIMKSLMMLTVTL